MRKTMWMMAFLVVLYMSINAFAQDDFEALDGEYDATVLEDGTTELTKYTGDDDAGVVPNSFNDKYDVSSIGEQAFYENTSLVSLIIPSKIKKIGKNAFCGCSNLEVLTFYGEDLNCLEPGAFGFCPKLEEVSIPDNVIEMTGNPFPGCEDLRIDVSPDHPIFATIEGVLFDKTEKRLICCPDRESTYSVPEGIKSIANQAFCGDTKLKEIVLPDSLEQIEDKAFWRCEGLTSMVLPDEITFIGPYAFAFCENLTHVELPKNITSIEESTFLFCRALTDIVIPDGVATIGSDAFTGCNNLKSLILPESITSIAHNAFYYCNNLTITVERDSYAAEFCKKNDLRYTYPDANDWLNN